VDKVIGFSHFFNNPLVCTVALTSLKGKLIVTTNALEHLLAPVRLGRLALKNRMVMAPMTRSRAAFDGTPGELAAEYYVQRASVGLIVTEGTQPSDDGQGYLATPGIYSDAHVAG
jgi:N-ethylmaleimide reductase